MNNAFESDSHSQSPAIAILGVPFDPVTMNEALVKIERMVVSRQPHYVVTANVDFLTQARSDVELRRILLDADLVLCDGTPVLWASRLLGNPLPERVAGADLVPRLVRIAAEQNLRLFFLGGTPESMTRALANVKAQNPGLQVDGYSPPFNHLLEMDHDEIKRRISHAQPDLLFVSFGCPKQEKWIAMHYQSLGVPVAIGVGGTIDFLAGQLKRAPVWMQRTGTEWIFRLLQEPRRLFKRYARDLGVFGTSLLAQWWTMQIRKFGSQDNSLDGQCSVPRSVSSRNTIVRRHVQIASSRCCVERAGSIGGGFVPGLMLRHGSKKGCASSRIKANADWQWIQLPKILDVTTIKNDALLGDPILADGRHCLLQMDRVQFIDSTGMGWLMRLRKKIRATGKQLVLIDAHPAVNRALKLLHIQEFFAVAPDFDAARILIQDISFEQREWVRANSCRVPKQIVSWRGEITAANADPVWQETEKLIRPEADSPQPLVIDLSQVRFMDSSGLGVMVRARKLAQREGVQLSFDGPQPAVLNVLRIAQLENFLLGQLS